MSWIKALLFKFQGCQIQQTLEEGWRTQGLKPNYNNQDNVSKWIDV